MAKETKKEVKSATTLTEDNVMEAIRKGSLIDEEVIIKGDEQDDKELQERKIQEYRCAKNRAKYQNYKALLQLRARRREEKATKEWLNKTKELFDDLCAGKTTPTEYDGLRKEAAKERDKVMSESSKQLNKEISALQRTFPGYYRWEWDD